MRTRIHNDAASGKLRAAFRAFHACQSVESSHCDLLQALRHGPFLSTNLRLETDTLCGYVPSDRIAFFDELVDDVGTEESVRTSNLGVDQLYPLRDFHSNGHILGQVRKTLPGNYP